MGRGRPREMHFFLSAKCMRSYYYSLLACLARTLWPQPRARPRRCRGRCVSKPSCRWPQLSCLFKKALSYLMEGFAKGQGQVRRKERGSLLTLPGRLATKLEGSLPSPQARQVRIESKLVLNFQFLNNSAAALMAGIFKLGEPSPFMAKLANGSRADRSRLSESC